MIKIAAAVSGVTQDDIRGKRQCAPHVHARFITAFLFREFGPVCYAKIGRAIAKDRTTARNAIRRIDGLRRQNPEFNRRCELALAIAKNWHDQLTVEQAKAAHELAAPAWVAPKYLNRMRGRNIRDGAAALRADLVSSEAKFLAVVKRAYREGGFKERAGAK